MHVRYYLWWALFVVMTGWTRSSVAQAPTPPVDTLRGITYATVDQHPLLLDIYRPAHQQVTVPVVLAVHGGSWLEGSGDRSQVAPLGQLLASRGYAVVAMDYRLLPAYHYPAQIEDVRTAARWTQANAGRYQFDMRHALVFGVSAGGQLAALLALQPVAGVPKFVGVIDFFGPMDFTVAPPNLQAAVLVRLYLHASREENPQVYVAASPISYVTAAAPPFLIVHGTADPIVPYTQSTRMADALRRVRVPVTLFPLPGLGHEVPGFTTPVGQQLQTTLLSFMQQLAPTAAGDRPAVPAPQPL